MTSRDSLAGLDPGAPLAVAAGTMRELTALARQSGVAAPPGRKDR
jgi:hypothetical protein